jgi:hypothetical protein
MAGSLPMLGATDLSDAIGSGLLHEGKEASGSSDSNGLPSHLV